MVMNIWLLHLLVFIFGYVTCRTFYFFRANRISLSLIKLSHIIYLSTVIRSIETLIEARTTALVNNIEPTKSRDFFEDEIKTLKESSVAYLLQLHPKFYRDILAFDDWESSMRYLNQNKEAVFKIWKMDHD
ncbi:MAG: hypothetical protein CMF52_03115 [Legionellales bacterium]|nr:hypothetical protein [Legionellales bacterium]